MHLKKLTIVVLVFCLSMPALFAQNAEFLKNANSESIPNYTLIKNNMNQYFQSFPEGAKKVGYKQYKRWEWFWESRTLPDGSFPDGTSLMQVYSNSISNQQKGLKLQGYDWKLIGPVNTPTEMMNSTGLGRINTIEFHPNTPDDIWIGAAGGGIWHSTNKGGNWVQSYPDNKFTTLGVNDISISYTNPKVLYAATGDAFGAQAAGYSTYSVGIIKSTDKGLTWEVTGMKNELNSSSKIAAVLVSQTDENVVIAATRNGMYKTIDGGATWSIKQAGDEFYDIEVHPTNPNVVYASTFVNGGPSSSSKIFKSTNFGDTWTKVFTNSSSVRTQIAVTADDPDGIFALVCSYDQGFNSFWYSGDMGANWEKMSDRSSTTNILGWQINGDDNGGQGWYDLALAVDPNDMSKIYSGGVHVWSSNDIGRTFKIATHSRGAGQLPYVHADVHDMKYTKDGSRLYLTCDGGVYYTTDYHNWIDITNGLPITQFYRFCSDNKNPARLVAGAQDNSTIKKNGDAWDIVFGGDGTDCWIDPNNAEYWYYSYVFGEFYRSINSGVNKSLMIRPDQYANEEGAWISPMAMDFANTNKLYVGFKQIYKSEDYGKTNSWTPISAFSNNDPMKVLTAYKKAIYAVNYTTLYYTYDDGIHWLTKAMYGVSSIVIDPNNTKHAWITQSGFSEGNKVFEFNDGTMTNVSGNLPNVPVNCIAYQKNSPNRLFIGTDVGVYYSDYNSGFWQRYGTSLPNTIVTDIELLSDHNLIRISSYGRGLWEAPLTNCNLPQPQIESEGNLTFCAGGSALLRAKTDKTEVYWSTGETTKEIIATKTGLYSYTIKEGDCTATSAGIQVTVYETPKLTIDPTAELAFCRDQNEDVPLRASSGFNTYLWSTGATTREITVTQPGTYSVTATTKDGCSTTTEMTVVERDRPAKPEVLYYQGVIWSSVNASKYKWYKDGKPLPQSNLKAINIGQDETDAGIYSVEIWDEYGCEAQSDGLSVIASVNDLNAGEYLNVTPNPFDQTFKLDVNLEVSGNVIIQISDINGKLVYETKDFISNNQISQTIDLGNISSGVYMIYIKCNDKSWVKRIVKK
ncbi:MAG: T9SS type A sorting domain-containing protein [bacterium]